MKPKIIKLQVHFTPMEILAMAEDMLSMLKQADEKEKPLESVLFLEDIISYFKIFNEYEKQLEIGAELKRRNELKNNLLN